MCIKIPLGMLATWNCVQPVHHSRLSTSKSATWAVTTKDPRQYHMKRSALDANVGFAEAALRRRVC